MFTQFLVIFAFIFLGFLVAAASLVVKKSATLLLAFSIIIFITASSLLGFNLALFALKLDLNQVASMIQQCNNKLEVNHVCEFVIETRQVPVNTR